MHKVGSAQDAITMIKVYCTKFNYISKMDLGSLTINIIVKTLIIILLLVEYLTHMGTPPVSFKPHKSLANFKKFFYFFG